MVSLGVKSQPDRIPMTTAVDSGRRASSVGTVIFTLFHE